MSGSVLFSWARLIDKFFHATELVIIRSSRPSWWTMNPPNSATICCLTLQLLTAGWRKCLRPRSERLASAKLYIFWKYILDYNDWQLWFPRPVSEVYEYSQRGMLINQCCQQLQFCWQVLVWLKYSTICCELVLFRSISIFPSQNSQ